MRPLHGIRVLDLSRVLSGPFCTMRLGDLGAEVIKIEEPGTGDDTREFGPPFVNGVSTYYLSINRNKKSVAVDLKAPEGRALVQSLSDRSDVVVENFRPGVAERLGLGAEELRRRNPRLVYCSISGYGHQGLPEYSKLPGYDVVVQGLSGLQDLTGEPDGPPTRAGVPITDILAGMTAFEGIAVALWAREREGRGQVVDISMLDSSVPLLCFLASAHLNAGVTAKRMGNRHPSIAPYETFRARDGYFNLAVGNDALFEKLCHALGAPELAADPHFGTNPLRVQHRLALGEALEAAFSTRGVADWVALFDAAGIPCGPIHDLATVLAHPQLWARGMISQMEHPRAGKVRAIGNPVRVEGGSAAEAVAPPEVGQHTREVLADVLGMSAAEVERLVAAGVVGAMPQR